MKAIIAFAASALFLLPAGEAHAVDKPVPGKKAAAVPVQQVPVQQVIGDWVVACVPVSGGHKSCMMSQTLASKRLGRTVSVFTIGRDQSGKLKGSLRVPVGVALTPGVVVGFEDKNSFTVPYTACHRIGCFAPFDLTEPILGQMRKATKVSAVAQSVSQQALSFNFSTRGFPAAYETYLKESR